MDRLKLIVLPLLFTLSLPACSLPFVSKTAVPGSPLPENGIISRNTVLSGEIKIDQDILVLPGVTLTIRPGSRLLFLPTKNPRIEPRLLYTSHELLVQGRLLAEGTPDAPIVFTSAAETPKMKDWAGIILDNHKGEDSVIQHCRIEYAQVGIYCIGASPDIIQNKLKGNETGMICQSGARPQIKGNTITEGNIGIACWEQAVPLISQNRINKQKQAGIIWSAGASPWLENNIVTDNKYGLYGSEPLEWVNNQIENNSQDFYLSNQSE